MNEADRIAEQRVRKARQAAQQTGRRIADQQASQRRDILQQIRHETQQVLPLLQRAGYPGMVSLTFKEATFFGNYKPKVRGAWLLGTFDMEEGYWTTEGPKPLHLLSDGSFAAFGHNRYQLDELDDETWWKRDAPQTILRGLQDLRSSLLS